MNIGTSLAVDRPDSSKSAYSEPGALPTVVYISSAGHSGSTLLDMMIGNLSTAESLGELMLMGQELALGALCTCGVPLARCSLWSVVLRRQASGQPGEGAGVDFGWMAHAKQKSSPARLAYRVARALSHGCRYLELKLGLSSMRWAEGHYRRGIQSSLEIYTSVAQITGKSVVVNSSKPYLVAVDHAQELGDRCRVINLIRDGRAVFASFLRHGFDRRFALKAWKDHYERALPLFDRYIPDERILTVRYEDLVQEPENVIRKVCGFIGVPFEDSFLDFSRVHHNVNGNDIRFRSEHRLRLDERWRRELNEEQLQYFMRRAGGLMQRLGYR